MGASDHGELTQEKWGGLFLSDPKAPRGTGSSDKDLA